MKATRDFEAFVSTINELTKGLMLCTNRCFNIGIGGGCGLRCAAFCDGECEEPYEFDAESLREEFDANEIADLKIYYPKFDIGSEATQ